MRSESVHWATFAAGSAGYLAMLVADARTRVTSWGRPVLAPRPDREEPSSRLGGSAGRRVGLAAIAVAVAVPALLPETGSAGMFGLGERGTGGSTTITTGDCAGTVLDLRKARRLGRGIADGNGMVVINLSLSSQRCGLLMQALDLGVCATSNVADAP